MRISDWSSDVCSSDLVPIEFLALEAGFVVQARLVDIDPIAEQEARDLGEPRVRREAGHRVALAVDLEDRADFAALRRGDERFRVERGGMGEQTARRRLPMRDLGLREERSEKRSVGKEWVRTSRSRGSPSN